VSTNTVSIPQPLTGTEIRHGIAVRMTQDLPADVEETLREKIEAGLGKTCSLLPHTAYAKFKAQWRINYWTIKDAPNCSWWVDYELDDFGRITKGGIGDGSGSLVDMPPTIQSWDGVIDEVPPDRFRRETDQPIPKPTELKMPEREKSSFSKSLRGSGKRRDV
jgi:hypothetical protein